MARTDEPGAGKVGCGTQTSQSDLVGLWGLWLVGLAASTDQLDYLLASPRGIPGYGGGAHVATDWARRCLT